MTGAGTPEPRPEASFGVAGRAQDGNGKGAGVKCRDNVDLDEQVDNARLPGRRERRVKPGLE